MSRRFSAIVLTVLFLLASLPEFISAQNTAAGSEKGRTSSSPASYQEPSRSKGGFRLGIHVDLVMMYTSVFDRNGDVVTGLSRDNFTVFEDGVEQNISLFAQEDIPVSTGILLDLSASMRPKMDQVNKAALSFIGASNPADEVFLIGFNDEILLLQDYTSDSDDIQDALDSAVVTGGTALYDAVWLGVQKAMTGDRSKKAILVISDGEDKDSYYELNDVIAKIDESEVQVFSIGILEKIPQQSLFGRWSRKISQQAADALRKMSEATGGKAFFPEELNEINEAVSAISRELRSQYSIGYVSSNAARDGTFRQVRIQVTRPGTSTTNVRHRRGYFAPIDDKAEKQ